MDLNDYLIRCEELGLDSKLPTYFNNIIDRNLYKPSVIAEVTKISTETARRWFREGKLVTETASNTYKVSGEKLKGYLFTLPNVIGPIKKAYPELFNSSDRS